MDSAAEILRNSFQRYADRVFLVDSFSGNEYTYQRVERLSLKLTGFLKSRGLKKGDRLGFMLNNSIECALFYFAALQMGAVAVPINPAFHPREKAFIIEKAGLHSLLVSPEDMETLKDQEIESGVGIIDPFSLTAEELPSPGHASFENIQDTDLAAIMFSSGTTGVPKGVPIEYGKFARNGGVFIDTLQIRPEMRFLGALSMSYIAGWYNLLMIPFIAGASLVLGESFNAALSLSFWSQCKKFKVTALWLVPTIMSILLSVARGDGIPEWARRHIKLALVGTAPLSLDLKEKFEKKFGVAVYENYALSETLFISTHAPGVQFKPESAGVLLDGVTVDIVDPDGNSLPIGETGEIVAVTPYGIASYDDDSEQTAELVRDGRYFTGDLGEMDRENYLYIRGRKKDLIIRGGINIVPLEIEEVLQRHPAVHEASVVGMPHPTYGEDTVATLKLHPGHESTTTEEIIAFCRDHLSDFKCPWKVFFIDELPKNLAGKVQKEKLKVLLKSKMVSLLG